MEKQLTLGDIVISKKGHDKAEIFVVVSIVNEDFVLISDGKSRTLGKSKLKRKRHLDLVTHDGLSEEFERKTITDAIIQTKLKNLIENK
ncbi:MAG: hypothetical protein RR416_00430 [Clostridia bacterium]